MDKQTQKVDEYVSKLIEKYGKKLGINIDPKNPTRESRLELALKLDERGDNTSQWEAMEIMVGRRVDSQEEMYGMLFVMYKMGKISKEKFYGGFP